MFESGLNEFVEVLDEDAHGKFCEGLRIDELLHIEIDRP